MSEGKPADVDGFSELPLPLLYRQQRLQKTIQVQGVPVRSLGFRPLVVSLQLSQLRPERRLAWLEASRPVPRPQLVGGRRVE